MRGLLASLFRAAIAAILLIAASIALAVGWAFLSGRTDPEVQRLIAGGTILSAIATVVLALATFVAVGEAGRQAAIAQDALAASRDAVAAANRQAEASTKQADASARSAAAAEASIAELQRSHQLEYQPRLAFEDAGPIPGWKGLEGPSDLQLALRNLGRGPALDCVFAFHGFDGVGDHVFGASIRFDVGPGEAVDKNAHAGRHPQLARILTERELIHPPERFLVVAYRDVIGNRYRVSRRGFDYRTERVSVEGTGTAPEWATWVERT